jgi:sporulation protein YlmC with PRC-barrel domain
MRLTDLLGANVVAEDGEEFGHVHDVRVRRLERRTSDGYELRVIGLVVGGHGIRERLGIDVGGTHEPIAARDVVEWERVVRVDDEAGLVTVRPG